MRQRFYSHDSAQAWQSHVEALGTALQRMDYGATYALPPRSASLRKPLQRALVFDIDADDFPQRPCKCQKRVCAQCWALVAHCAAHVQRQCEERFGWTRFVQFFSGRRGIHLYCVDDECFTLQPEARKRVVRWLCAMPGVVLDEQVTVALGHLCKVPLTFHPATSLLAQFLPAHTDFDPQKDSIALGNEAAANDNIALFNAHVASWLY